MRDHVGTRRIVTYDDFNAEAGLINWATSQAVQALMIKRGGTVIGVAERIGRSRKALYDRLSGRTEWTVHELAVIAKLFGTEVHHILRYAQGAFRRQQEINKEFGAYVNKIPNTKVRISSRKERTRGTVHPARR